MKHIMKKEESTWYNCPFHQKVFKSIHILRQVRNSKTFIDIDGPNILFLYYGAHYSFIGDCLDAYMHMLAIKQMESNPPAQVLFMSSNDLSHIARNILMKYIKNSDCKI